MDLSEEGSDGVIDFSAVLAMGGAGATVLGDAKVIQASLERLCSSGSDDNQQRNRLMETLSIHPVHLHSATPEVTHGENAEVKTEAASGGPRPEMLPESREPPGAGTQGDQQLAPAALCQQLFPGQDPGEKGCEKPPGSSWGQSRAYCTGTRGQPARGEASVG